MELFEFASPITYIMPDGTIKSHEYNEANQYEICQDIFGHKQDKALILLHDNETQKPSLWNGSLWFHDEMTPEQIKITKEILQYSKMWKSFFSQNEYAEYPFHGQDFLRFYIPAFKEFSDEKTQFIHDCPTFIVQNQIFTFSILAPILDEDVLVDAYNEFLEKMDIRKYFLSLKEAIYFFLSQQSILVIQDFKNDNMKNVYLPEFLTYVERVFLFSYLKRYSDIKNVYMLDDNKIKKIYDFQTGKSLFWKLNLSTRPSDVYTLRRKNG